MEPSIGIVILNWNGRDRTADCLHSIRGISYPDFRTVVVDNASTDGSAEEIKRLFPEVTLMRNSFNAGYDGGNNIGIRAALELGADFVLLLNNDTVVDGNILREFVGAASSLPRAGVFGPKIYLFDRPDEIWWAGCRRKKSVTGRLLVYTQEGKGERDRGQYEQIKTVDAVHGCAMFIRGELLKQIGSLDERFFIYHEEYEFCERAKRAGWDCIFVPGAKVWHRVACSMGGQSSPSFNYLWTRNWLLLSRRQTRLPFWPMLYIAYFREVLWVYNGLMRRGERRAAEAALAGGMSAALNRFGPPGNPTPPRWLSGFAKWNYSRGR